MLGGGTAGDGSDHLFVGTSSSGLTPAQLAQIRFYSDGGVSPLGLAAILSSGEIIAGGVTPEPSAAALVVVGILGMGAVGVARRRRVI